MAELALRDKGLLSLLDLCPPHLPVVNSVKVSTHSLSHGAEIGFHFSLIETVARDDLIPIIQTVQNSRSSGDRGKGQGKRVWKEGC